MCNKKRTQTLLTPHEADTIVQVAFEKHDSKAHSEILDAIGIGLYMCGRVR